jgi:hypothetical protein
MLGAHLVTPAETAALSGEPAWIAGLVEIRFATETVRLTPLDLPSLDLPDGTIWRGIGAQGAIGPIEQPSGEGAPTISLRLSGLDEDVYRAVIASETEAKNRLVQVGVALWSGARATDETFIARRVLFTGRIDRIIYASVPNVSGDGVVISRTRTVTATVESIFAENRARTKAALYSDVQQKIWYPGDTGLAYLTRAADKSVDWPLQVVG